MPILTTGLGSGNTVLPDWLEKLRHETRPIVILGAGVMAHLILQRLGREGIRPVAYVIDATPEPGAQLADIPVISLESLHTDGREHHIILGFVPVDQDLASIRERVLARSGAGELSILDFSALAFGEFNRPEIDANLSRLERVFGWLSDDVSKATMTGFINARMSFDPSHIAPLYTPNQYFDSGVLHLGENECFVDCGAFDGDTIARFLGAVGNRYREIVAFEPDPANFSRLERSVAARKLDHVALVEKGTWDAPGTLTFSAGSERTSGISGAGEITVAVDTIDNHFAHRHATLIKMDVEGAELASLKGAQSTILRDKPKLAICVYHKFEDLFEIPEYIKSLVPEYRLFLRCHTRFSQELVLYATT